VVLKLVKLPKMTKAEIDHLIRGQILCRIAFGGKTAPYIAPFQYVFFGGHLYFHFTNYGRKMGLLEEGQLVCVEIEKYKQNLSEYRFIVLTGKLQIITEQQERAKAISKMVETAKTKRLSPIFLQAHGLPKEAGWSALSEDKPLVIVKLVEVTEITGLKSP
jgi:nitroimidazol reductase NimA-like FMN-containing flavoprotein (pyridoxamine 5'-phosphate oxidase superfamily)